MKTTETKKRESNIELLRILSMLMIVFYHFAYHGGFINLNLELNINHFWYTFLLVWGKLGVNIFVLITGYFLVSKDVGSFSIKHLLKFIFQVLFYSIFISIIFNILTGTTFNLNTILKTIFPIIYGRWWFASTYFVLYLFHPFINKLLVNLTKKEYCLFILMLVLCFSIIPTFFSVSFQGNNFIWFVLLYSIAGYIKIYEMEENISWKVYFILFVILFLITYAASIKLLLSNINMGNVFIYIKDFYSQNQIYMLMMAVCLFKVFNKIKIKYNFIINFVASSMFGVYLIHDVPLIRNILWQVLFKFENYYNSIILIPYSILVCLSVFCCCCFIEILRQKLIEKPFLNIIKKYS